MIGCSMYYSREVPLLREILAKLDYKYESSFMKCPCRHLPIVSRSTEYTVLADSLVLTWCGLIYDAL